MSLLHSRRTRRPWPSLLGLPALVILLGACAGSTVNAGVAPRSFDEPPFYSGRMLMLDSAAFAHAPVAVSAAFFDRAIEAEPGTPAAALLSDMNAYLDSLGVSARLVPATTPTGTPPDVSFGCEEDGMGDCLGVDGEAGEEPRMMLQVARPSGSWIEWLAPELRAADADALLLITLELSDHMPRSRGFRARKEIPLGTGRVEALPWLTSMDQPIQVLQLTGGLFGPDGKAVRIGAEGLLAKRTRFLLSAFEIQELFTDEDVERLRTLRRDDIEGEPLVWQVALGNLVGQLTGRSELIRH